MVNDALMMILMTIALGTQVHRMMSLDTLHHPRGQTHTGLRGGFCHHHEGDDHEDLDHHDLHQHCDRHHRHRHCHHISLRALFGPTDHEENLRFVRKELKKAKNEAANKW